MGVTQRYRLIETLIETGVEPTYTWRDVSVIPTRILPPASLVLGLTPLVDQRYIAALEDLRARRFDVAVVEVDPVRLVHPGPSATDSLAYRLWLLEREVVRARLVALGIGIGTWGDRDLDYGARGGEDVQALRTTGTRLATGIASVACLLATLALPMTRGGDAFQVFGVRIGAVAFIALVAGIVLGWTPLVPVSAALAGGLYGAELAISDAPLDTAAPGVAAALLLCTELAYWSGEERTRWLGDVGDGLRRAAVVALLGAGAFFVAAILLALVDTVPSTWARIRPARRDRGGHGSRDRARRGSWASAERQRLEVLSRSKCSRSGPAPSGHC